MKQVSNENKYSGGIVGLYVATSAPDGVLLRQGEIIGEWGGFAVVQLFSFVDGRDTLVEFYRLPEILTDPNWSFFSTAEEWRHHVEGRIAEARRKS